MKVAAEVSAYGATAGASALNKNDKETSSFFSSLESEALAAVGDYQMTPMEELLMSGNLNTINKAAKDHGIDDTLSADDLATIKKNLAAAINKYCKASNLNCCAPTKDKPLPKPYQVCKLDSIKVRSKSPHL